MQQQFVGGPQVLVHGRTITNTTCKLSLDILLTALTYKLVDPRYIRIFFFLLNVYI